VANPAPTHQRQRRARIGGVLALAALLALSAALPYLGAGLSRTFINFDDQEYVYENPHVLPGLTLAGVRWALVSLDADNWHPLTWISHMADVSLFGLDARGHHATSVMVHALSTVLLFLALRALTGALWPSAFTAALFGVHPLHVESVAWVAERKDVLSGLFFMLVLLAYARYVRRGGAGRYLTVAALLALGLAAKPMLVTVPFVLLLLDYWPLGRTPPARPAAGSGPPRPSWGRLVAEKLPLLVLAGASGALTVLAQSAGGAVADVAVITLDARLANALVAYATYCVQALWPSSLALYYPHPLAGLPWWKTVAAFVALAAVSLAVLSRARRLPFLAVGWLWYLGMLVPVIGLLQVGEQARADRYTYLPLIGLFLLAAWGVPGLLSDPRWRRWAFGAALAAVLALAAASGLQAGYWRDSIALYSRTLAVTSDNWQILNTLGASLLSAGRPRDAVAPLREAVRVRPGFATAHYNLGVALTSVGERAQAVEHFREAVRIRPGYVKAQYSLGIALVGLRQPAEAAVHLRRALPDPGLDGAASRGEMPFEPLGDLEKVIAGFNLGNVLADLGQYDEAIARYLTVLRTRPDWAEAQYHLGNALSRAGRYEEAVARYREALRLAPGLAECEYHLGNTLVDLGLLEEAVAHYREALRVRPDFAAARNNLATVLGALGRE
jgi:tetratricopeptide (TPR) repeat protein